MSTHTIILGRVVGPPGPRGEPGEPGARGFSGGGNPVGSIVAVMGNTAPAGYLVCDGAAYPIAGFPDLAAYFLEQFGTVNKFGGDGVTTFAVPDLRNLFLRGYHGSADPLSGEIGVKQWPTVQSNVMTALGGDTDGWIGWPGNIYYGAQQYENDSYGSDTDYLRFTTGVTLEKDPNYRYPKSFTSRPVNMAVLYCIKAKEPEIILENRVPTGTIIPYMGKVDAGHPAPEGYLACDGSEVDAEYYSALAAFFLGQFGAVNHFGGTAQRFRLPDLRNLFLRGYHGGAEALSGNIGVRQYGTKLPYISTWAGDGQNVLYSMKAPDGQGNLPIHYEALENDTMVQTSADMSYVGPGSVPVRYGIRPVNMAVVYCIKYA